MTEPTTGLVASRRGVRVDTETGWSSIVATDVEDCERLAAAFTAMAARLRKRPDVVAEWDRLADLDIGDANRDDIPEAMVRADEREQLAESGRLLPAGTETVEQFNTRLYRDGVLMDEPDTSQTREHAQARVDWHARKREQEPGWRGEAVLVRRQQHTTPWEPVDSSSVNLADPLEALLDMPVRIRFWVCPVAGHSSRNNEAGRPVVTVEWRGDIAYCTAPDCGRNSQPTTAEEQR